MRWWAKFLSLLFVAIVLIEAGSLALYESLQPAKRPPDAPPSAGTIRVPSLEPVRFHLVPRKSYSIYQREP